MTDPETGVIAISRAGHDKGRAFVILRREGTEYVFIADGVTRRVAEPKKKKLKHLLIEPRTAEAIRELMANGTNPTDADIRRALCALGYPTKRQ